MGPPSAWLCPYQKFTKRAAQESQTTSDFSLALVHELRHLASAETGLIRTSMSQARSCEHKTATQHTEIVKKHKLNERLPRYG